MTESSGSIPSSFGQLRKEYSAQREQVEHDLADSDLIETHKSYKRLRRNFAKKNTLNKLQLEAALEGMEVDSLTGLKNRRGFDRVFNEELDRLKRYKTSFAVIIMDANYLKKFNDEHGHPAGDAYLKAIAEVLKKTRRSDVAARFGGDEFGIVLANADETSIQEWWNRTFEELDKAKVHISHNVAANISLGAGARLVTNDNLPDSKTLPNPEELSEETLIENEIIRQADTVLSVAKKQAKELIFNQMLQYKD